MPFLARVQSLYANARRYYDGADLEAGKTSRNLPIGPWINVVTKLLGDPKSCGPILDVGAGKDARVANKLRPLGYTVYAYDPFNGDANGGFENGSSNVLPDQTFEFVMSTFVLNVVKKRRQEEILSRYKHFARKQIHVTRNMDIYDTVKNNLKKQGSNIIKNFYAQEYDASPDFRSLTKDQILDFCYFGVKTRDGFQRIPELELEGLSLVKASHNWKVYKNF